MWQNISEIIIQYICAIILMFGVYSFGKFILDEEPKISKKKLFVLLQIIYIIQVIVYLNSAGTLKTVVMLIINAIFYKQVFKISTKKSILLVIVYIIMLIALDLLCMLSVTELLNYSKTFCYEKFAGSILGNLMVCALLLIVTYVFKNSLKKIINNEIDHNVKIVLLSVLTLICILFFFYTIIKEFKFNDDIIIYLVAIFVMTLVLFSLIKQIIRNNKLLHEYDKLLEFMTTYENEIENQRILRHEIKNEFKTIRAKICDKQENKEIIEYIDEIVNEKYEMDKEKYVKFGYLPPNGIKGLCYFKTQEAEGKGINVSLNISKRVKDSSIYNLTIKEQRDFGRIIGVFLDNAIEASAESKEKKMGIEAYINSEKEFRMIITNTYNNKIDKNKIGRESYSTKGKTRGHGLLLVKQLKSKNERFKIKTEIQENIYVQTIEIKKI